MEGGVLWNFGEGEARGMERETGEGGRGIREELYINGSRLIIYFLSTFYYFYVTFYYFLEILCYFYVAFWKRGTQKFFKNCNSLFQIRLRYFF